MLAGGLLGIKCCYLVAESQVLKFGVEREFRFIRISIPLYLILIKQVELPHLIFVSFVCLVVCLRQGLILLFRLAWSLLCSPGWLPWFGNPPESPNCDFKFESLSLASSYWREFFLNCILSGG